MKNSNRNRAHISFGTRPTSSEVFRADLQAASQHIQRFGSEKVLGWFGLAGNTGSLFDDDVIDTIAKSRGQSVRQVVDDIIARAVIEPVGGDK